MAVQRPHVLRKTAKAQPKDPGGEVRDPFKNQEPGIAGDKAEPRMALRGGPAEPGDTIGDLTGTRASATALPSRREDHEFDSKVR